MVVTRQTMITINERPLSLPVYFPSISSVKTTLCPITYLQVVSSLAGLNGQFLISAFDLATIDTPDYAAQILKKANEAGAVTLMDSGNYESFWKDAQGNWLQANFHEMLQAFPCDLAFGFDEQHPPKNVTEHVGLIVSRWRADQAAADKCQIVPIIHGAADELPILCTKAAEATGVFMVAVPERRLGDGVMARARAVAAIRHELNKQDRYIALHLLGTGNPISIAIYAVMGADSFDGLEWCQTVVDHETALLYHLSQADFFMGQTAWTKADLSFHARTLAHNLEFYTNWMKRLHSAMQDGKVIDFFRFNFTERVFQQCTMLFGWD